MDYNKFEIFVSKARLDRFLLACKGSKTGAFELYKANLLISQAFYPVFNLFEIFLRNTINRILISHFRDTDWIRNQKLIFMNDSTLASSNYFLRESVSKAETNLARKRIQITSGRILAEQSLGFWTSLFERHHYRLLQGSIISCFPLKPAQINRSNLAITLQEIKDFRNRVYHNEPICFNHSNINFGYAEKINSDIYNILDWIDIELSNHVKFFDKINKRISAARRI